MFTLTYRLLKLVPVSAAPVSVLIRPLVYSEGRLCETQHFLGFFAHSAQNGVLNLEQFSVVCVRLISCVFYSAGVMEQAGREGATGPEISK